MLVGGVFWYHILRIYMFQLITEKGLIRGLKTLIFNVIIGSKAGSHHLG